MTVSGTVLVESDNCPADWRGSGVYDVEERAKAYASAVVNAETKEEAIKIAKEFASQCDSLYEVEEIEIDDVYFDEADDDAVAGLVKKSSEYSEAYL